MAEFTVYAGAASGWDSSSNATGAPDGSYAYEDNNSDGFKYLTLGNFNIPAQLPVGAVIDKLTVATLVKGNSGTSGYIYGKIYARINGVDQSASSQFTLSLSAATRSKYYTSGDPVDPANLTDALFAVMISAEFVDVSSTRKAECDYVAVTVEYHMPSVGLEMGCNF